MDAISISGCEVCDSSAAPDFLIDNYLVGLCSECGHQFVPVVFSTDHADAVYGDDYFFAGGAGYPDYLREGPDLIKHGQRYAKIINRHAPAGHVLDVGSAAGFILKGFVDSGWTGMGIEPNATMVRYGREKLGVNLTQGCFEEFQPSQAVDLVSMIQVISHFYDLKLAIRHAEAVLKPGGLCLVETWDRRSLMARLSGKGWHEYSPPSVLRWFTRGSLRRLFELAGMKEIAYGRPRKGISGEHARSLLEYKLGGGRFASVGGRMLRVIPASLHIPYPGDDLFWAIYRKPSD